MDMNWAQNLMRLIISPLLVLLAAYRNIITRLQKGLLCAQILRMKVGQHVPEEVCLYQGILQVLVSTIFIVNGEEIFLVVGNYILVEINV